ncbi:hypoxanthine phosphoribosyltransferase [bacterium]|nr:hypoxanthine phosphoribosyltransferase [candidate division CSSED10-310 bacterium]
MKRRVLIEEKTLQNRVKELAKQISEDYKDKNPLLVGVLKGAFVFMADIIREITIPHTLDFMAVSSYGASTTTSGVVRILKDLDAPLFNRHVLIVEDIVDSGLTLRYIMRLLAARSPASLKVCALLDKTEAHQSMDLVDYRGFEIPNQFVIGYGLDYDQYYRNLPYIAVFEEKVP